MDSLKPYSKMDWLHIAGSLTSVTAFILLILEKTLSSLNIIQILITLMFVSLGVSILAFSLYLLDKISKELTKYKKNIQYGYWAFIVFVIIFLVLFLGIIGISTYKFFLRDLVPIWFSL